MSDNQTIDCSLVGRFIRDGSGDTEQVGEVVYAYVRCGHVRLGVLWSNAEITEYVATDFALEFVNHELVPPPNWPITGGA